MSDVIPRFAWQVVVDEGAEIPHGYGIAYYRAYARGAIAMPLPLNLIVGFFRALSWRMRCPPWRFEEYKYERGRKARADAWDDGYRLGHHTALWGTVGRDTSNPHR